MNYLEKYMNDPSNFTITIHRTGWPDRDGDGEVNRLLERVVRIAIGVGIPLQEYVVPVLAPEEMTVRVWSRELNIFQRTQGDKERQALLILKTILAHLRNLPGASESYVMEMVNHVLHVADRSELHMFADECAALFRGTMVPIPLDPVDMKIALASHAWQVANEIRTSTDDPAAPDKEEDGDLYNDTVAKALKLIEHQLVREERPRSYVLRAIWYLHERQTESMRCDFYRTFQTVWFLASAKRDADEKRAE